MKQLILLLLIGLLACQSPKSKSDPTPDPTKATEKKSEVKQQPYALKIPDSKKYLEAFTKSDYRLNVLDSFLVANYKDLSGKINIETDPDFDNAECGFTRNLAYGIIYKYRQCGEAKGVYEWLTLPKTDIATVKKFIEALAITTPVYEPYVWYKGKTNEYGPKSKEVGCYYFIEETATQTKIRIECGC